MDAQKIQELYIDGKSVSELYFNGKLAWSGRRIDISQEEMMLISVDLNGEWVSSLTALNPDPTKYDIYESNSNWHVANSFAKMYVQTSSRLSTDLYIRSYAETTNDYTITFNTDVDVTTLPAYNTAGVKAHTRGNQQSSQSLAAYTKVNYNLDDNPHKITVVYRKDSSVDSGTDRGYLIVEKKNQYGTKISNLSDRYEHTGSQIVPQISVSYLGTQLTQGTDYRIQLENNVNIGMAQLSVIGIKNYKGKLVKQFKIAHLMENAIVQGINDTYDYMSAYITPQFTITHNGNILQSGTDYIYEFKDNFFEGMAQCTISGLGDYDGTIVKRFEILNEPVTTFRFSDATVYLHSATSDVDMKLELKDDEI